MTLFRAYKSTAPHDQAVEVYLTDQQRELLLEAMFDAICTNNTWTNVKSVVRLQWRSAFEVGLSALNPDQTK